MQSNYTVINASAGSGKTYTLVQKLLLICLRQPHNPGIIRNILALTFTNKAANEMKHRIVDWLKNFSATGYETNRELLSLQRILEKDGAKVSLEELHYRSKKILDYVLHNYSALNIGTIDKFNARLVRSFSQELGLAQNFNLEIDASPFLLQAVDKMLEDIGGENEVSEAFMDFVSYSLDNNERVHLNKTLYNAAKEYVQDKHYFRLTQNSNFDWEKYRASKSTLRREIVTLKKEAQEFVLQGLSLMKEKDIDPAHFKGGMNNGLGKFFVAAAKYFEGKGNFPLPGNEESAVANFRGGASAAGKHKEAEVLEILDFLIASREQIIERYITGIKKEKILSALLPLKVNKEIQDKLALIESENDLVLLSKFNVLIHENLSTEPSSFIYEKVGTKFEHYFFDEFQDTSALQWKNIIPLRDNAVATKDTSFTLVGDPKQSIYRFRGGDAQLMLNIINKKEETPLFAEQELLDKNWRSAKNIVAFNNELYNYMAAHTENEHCDLFSKGAQQTPQSNLEGRVRVNLIEYGVNAIFYEEVAKKMTADIQQCVENGFALSDITILCRGNTDISNVAQLLALEQITYNGEVQYLKTVSEAGLQLNLSVTLKALTEFLRWEQDPKNLRSPVMMLYYLKQLGKIETKDFTAEMLALLNLPSRQEMLQYILQMYGLNLYKEEMFQLNLYNTVEQYLEKFAVPGQETDFIFNYLEMVFAWMQNGSATLKDFLKFWDEEGNETKIQVSENLDAVKIMTVHKAKGLEFPVVLLPMRNSNKDAKVQDWFDVKMENGCSSVNLSAFAKDLIVYDKEMEDFNTRHTYQNKIDRFCLQYVATTRAVEQLYFYIEKENKSANHLEIYDFLKSKIGIENIARESAFDLYEMDTAGLKKQSPPPTDVPDTQTVLLRPHTHERAEVKIATPSKNYQNRVEHVRTGIFVHEILAKVNSEKDIAPTLQNYLLEGKITAAEKEEISTRVRTIINENPDFFGEELYILNERDIMLSENGESILLRPDRLIKTDHGFIIIDFKTGSPRPEHEAQLAQYEKALLNLGHAVDHKTLIYV